MIGILTLHVVALLSWCAALLLLLGILGSAQLTTQPAPRLALVVRHNDSLARVLFTLVASPLALLTILSGTAVFLINLTTAPWLVIKLSFVAALVAGHTLAGLLILRLERKRSVRRHAWLLALLVGIVMLSILWLVLAKPGAPSIPDEAGPQASRLVLTWGGRS